MHQNTIHPNTHKTHSINIKDSNTMDNSIIDTVNETMNRNEQSIKTTRIIITGASLFNGINKKGLPKDTLHQK